MTEVLEIGGPRRDPTLTNERNGGRERNSALEGARQYSELARSGADFSFSHAFLQHSASSYHAWCGHVAGRCIGETRVKTRNQPRFRLSKYFR